MSRLETIKERLNEGVKTESGLSEIHDHAPDDIEYLLQRLERYEHAMNELWKMTKGAPFELYENKDRLMEVRAVVQTVRDQLKE